MRTSGVITTAAKKPRTHWWSRYSQFRLRTVALITVIAAGLLARYASEIRRIWNHNESPVKTIQTTKDLHQALRGQRSAIYCDVQWSLDAVVGRRVFAEFARRWRSEVPRTSVQFYLLDLTDRNAVVDEAVEHWGLSDTRGSGEILWMRDGIPRAYTDRIGSLSQAELAKLAEQAFELSITAKFPDDVDLDLYNSADLPVDQTNPNSGNVSR